MSFKEARDSFPIELLETKSVMTMEDVVKERDPKIVIVCDFNIEGMESAIFDEVFKTTVGARTILNVDHHVPVAAMMRFISSGNLAANYVRKYGVPEAANSVVKIHHTDCDSVISAAIMRGLIKPEKSFEAAVIAADHTGEENAIADLLQSLEHERDLLFSLEMLDLAIKGKSLPAKANALMENRRQERVLLKNMVQDGVFKVIDGVAYAELDKTIDAGLLPDLLPNAKAIVIGMPRDDGKRNMKVRLTPASPAGTSLSQLGLGEGFGGRWNAGSNKRGGGTHMTAAEYAQQVSKKL
jgi:hypothetical protein